MINEIVDKKIYNIKWLGCDHGFIDGLPKTACYFVSVHNDERVFLPGQPSPTTVKTLTENDAFAWKKVGFDGSKGTAYSDVKIIRCNAVRTNEKMLLSNTTTFGCISGGSLTATQGIFSQTLYPTFPLMNSTRRQLSDGLLNNASRSARPSLAWLTLKVVLTTASFVICSLL